MSRFFILYLCSLTLRTLVLAALAGLVTLRVRSVAGRHAVWTGVLACILLMPLADALLPASLIPTRAPEIVLPVQTFVAIPQATAIQPRTAALAPVFESPHRDWWQFAAFVWLGLASLFLCRLVVACGAIGRIKRSGQPVSSELIGSHDFRLRTPTLRESDRVVIPMTVGFFSPVLILPLGWRDWDDWKLSAVLAHELTHVRRMDWAIALSATLARSVFWFNPLIWWLERHLSSLAEQASDEACVQSTGDAPRYAETLLQFASVAKRGRRWIGGVAMAQYKISFRIERVLRLQKAGSGVLSTAGWIAASILTVCTLYVSAAAQSRTTIQLPPLAPAEIIRVVQQSLPLPEQPATQVNPAPRPSPSAQQPQPPQNNSPAPPSPAPAAVPQVNPDLIGEIKLILAPVDQAQNAVPGQIQVQTRTGTNRFTGTAVWTIRNGAVDANSWARNGNAYTFALTGVEGRTLFFETSQGGTFSYGCPDCSFLASEFGVGALSASAGTGIIFRLNPDGKSILVTCRAVECRAGSEVAWLGNSTQATGVRSRTLKDSESFEFAIPPQPAVPGSAIFFAVTR